MTVHYEDESVTVHHGDCLDVMAAMPDTSVDSIVTDPPYGLGFMGKAWDDLPPGEEWARECLRVLKPGGHLLAFGGTRTWHRLAVAVEDAGFEVRDSIAWLYGSGFPKSLNVGEGRGTALKPAFEPVVVGRKPLAGTVAATVAQYGTGALNIDGCRVATPDGKPVWDYPNGAGGHAFKFSEDAPNKHGAKTGPTGRWPANVLLDGSQADVLDEQSGIQRDGVAVRRNRPDGTDANPHGIYGSHLRSAESDLTYGGQGGASRFFPTFRYEAKAPTAERPSYVAADEAKAWAKSGFRKRCTKCGRQEVNVPGSMCVCPEPDFQVDPTMRGRVTHPTVKPLDLMRWLVRLVTPPGGTVLEPFAGSGTTAEACVIEGFRCVAIEREAAYLPLIVQRLSKPIQPDLFGGAA